MGRQVGGRGPLWCGAWFAGPKCPSLAATVGLACNDARPAGLLCWCLGTGVACLGAGWVSVVGGSAQSGPPQAWAAAEGTTVTAVILAALTRHTRASGRARAGRATRAVRVAALPRGGAGQPWRTVGPGPRLVRFSAVEPEQASLGDRLLLIVLGALFAFVFSMAIQLWIVPRVERRKRREERWERDVLALGELLTAEVPALATAAQRDA